MALSVAGRMITGPTSLSALARMTLAFIDGGLEWTSWATRSPASRYDFPDESALLDQVQKGLHASPTVWLPRLGLHISPLKLMSLGAEDLRALAHYESEPDAADPVLTSQVHQVLGKHDLISADELAAVPRWLDALGVGDAPLFAVLGLDDTLFLRQLASEVQGHGESLCREAASFSMQHARTPAEFGDYYRYYLERPAQTGSTLQTRSQEALETMQVLLPTLFATLGGPAVSNLPSPDELRCVIGSWMAAGRSIGFSRLTLALQQVARAAGPIKGGHAAEETTKHVLASANAFLIQTNVKHGLLCQSGSTVRYPMQSGDKHAVVEVRDGDVSLIEFGTLKERSADAATGGSTPGSLAQQTSKAEAAPPAPPPPSPAPQTRPTADDAPRRVFPTPFPAEGAPTTPQYPNDAIRAARAAAEQAVEQALAASDAAIRAALEAHSHAVAAAEDAMRRSNEASAEAERLARAAIENAERSDR